jgi:hypothetical protein
MREYRVKFDFNILLSNDTTVADIREDIYLSRDEVAAVLSSLFPQAGDCQLNSVTVSVARAKVRQAPKLFTVKEYFNHYACRHEPSGDEHPMGDGVDSVPKNDDGEFYCAGDPELLAAWERMLNADPDTVMEAYFPQHLAKERKRK